MKIESILIENFRCFKNQEIYFDNYTCFVGPNGAGKSTILNALNIFFRQNKDSKTDLINLSESDFHHKNTSQDIRITLTFTDLSEQAQRDLSDYVRLGKLVVSAVAKYDIATQKAEVIQYGSRLGFAAFKSFFEEGKKVPELKEVYSSFKKTYPDLRNATTKQDMIDALREYEASNPNKCSLIESEDQFYGAQQGDKLSPYIQWIFIPASKDATEEGEETKTSALGQLLDRTVRNKVNFGETISDLRNQTKKQYETILDSHQKVLNDISKSLKERLASWAHPNISAEVLWKQDPDKTIRIDEPWAYLNIGERGFNADLSRFGHGLQRSYMLALLQELVLFENENSPTLIMGIEEPEIYQHPPQARYLAEALLDLAEKDAQILLCTHSPLFIPGDNFHKVRLVRETGNPSFTSVTSLSYKDLLDEFKKVGEIYSKESGMVAKLYPSLNSITNEMFFCKILILVEGVEDVAYIASYLLLTNKMEEFRKYGCHIVPVNGKSNLIRPIAITNLLNIPTFVVCDADTDKTKDSEVIKHKQDNKTILTLLGYGGENEWPTNDIIKPNLTIWKVNLTDTVSKNIEKWDSFYTKACAHYGNAGKLEKNHLAIAKTLEFSWQENKKSEILSSLIDRIIEFAKQKSFSTSNAAITQDEAGMS